MQYVLPGLTSVELQISKAHKARLTETSGTLLGGLPWRIQAMAKRPSFVIFPLTCAMAKNSELQTEQELD